MSQSFPSCEQDSNKNTTTLDNQDNIDQQIDLQIIEKYDSRTSVGKRSKR